MDGRQRFCPMRPYPHLLDSEQRNPPRQLLTGHTSLVHQCRNPNSHRYNRLSFAHAAAMETTNAEKAKMGCPVRFRSSYLVSIQVYG